MSGFTRLCDLKNFLSMFGKLAVLAPLTSKKVLSKKVSFSFDVLEAHGARSPHIKKSFIFLSMFWKFMVLALLTSKKVSFSFDVWEAHGARSPHIKESFIFLSMFWKLMVLAPLTSKKVLFFFRCSGSSWCSLSSHQRKFLNMICLDGQLSVVTYLIQLGADLGCFVKWLSQKQIHIVDHLNKTT